MDMMLILCFPLFFCSEVRVHNDFLLAILTRCQIIVSTPGIKKNNITGLMFILNVQHDRL